MYIVCFDDLWIVQIHIDHIDLTRSSRNGYDGSLMGSSQAALCKVQPNIFPLDIYKRVLQRKNQKNITTTHWVNPIFLNIL